MVTYSIFAYGWMQHQLLTIYKVHKPWPTVFCVCSWCKEISPRRVMLCLRFCYQCIMSSLFMINTFYWSHIVQLPNSMTHPTPGKRPKSLFKSFLLSTVHWHRPVTHLQIGEDHWIIRISPFTVFLCILKPGIEDLSMAEIESQVLDERWLLTVLFRVCYKGIKCWLF